MKESSESYSESTGLPGAWVEAENLTLIQGSGVCCPGALQGRRAVGGRERHCKLKREAVCSATGMSCVKQEGSQDKIETINQALWTGQSSEAPWAHGPGSSWATAFTL